MRARRQPLLLISAICCAFSPGSLTANGPEISDPSLAGHVSNASDVAQRVRGLLSSKCFQCHGPDANAREGGFQLDNENSYLSPSDSGSPPIVPGDVAGSLVWQRITTQEDSERMPPAEHGAGLSQDELDLVSTWIVQGARLPMHWSFVAPTRPVPPTIALQPDRAAVPLAHQVELSNHPIDRFVMAQQLHRGFFPSPEASRSELLRRVSLDLTGLPPSSDELERFLADPSREAYERQVDRLLAQPSFGEHWARQWLDLARYADSAGYADDPDRTIWAYRDWVIRAFNDNMPFDQFTREQLAGDLLPNPTRDQLVATAFHRNTLTNNEGGTNDEEFRNVAVVDRVNTTMAVWMGVTMNCAQCHTHKYDPFTQHEYFQLFAILNQTQDADRKDESPLVNIYSEDQLQLITLLESKAVFQEMKIHQAVSVATVLHRWSSAGNPFSANLQVSLDYQPSTGMNQMGRSQSLENVGPRDFISRYYSDWMIHTARPATRQLVSLREEVKKMVPATTVPILRELSPSNQRLTRIHLRGDYKAQGDQVWPAVPAVFHPILLENPDAHPNRLDLAEWLVDPQNPLTARVMANRVWEALFGLGIVRTSEEFGAQGEPPSHPELLDWLATEWTALEWDFKAFLRLLVTSQTYRQTSKVSQELLERDRDNVWLSRGPRVRLTAEMIRDSLLQSSGLLSSTMHGPPVQPPQPSQGLKAAFGSATDWTTSEGEDRYRRAIYTKWRRSNPYPSMGTFDAPSREVCVVRRDSTNTPLQALITLNDPAYMEAAQALARKMIRLDSKLSDADRVAQAFRQCTSRPPQPNEQEALLQLLVDAREHFGAYPDEATQLATVSLGELPADCHPLEAASWTVVCNVLLNLDEVLMKR